MSPYEAMIDPAQFGTIARYLENPRSAIQYILHVRHRSILADLAAKLDGAMAAARSKPDAVSAILDPLLEDGALRISSRQELRFKDPNHAVLPSSIPKLASCWVIYLPPFYLAHTPGLFEGTLVQPELHPRQGPARRMKV